MPVIRKEAKDETLIRTCCNFSAVGYTLTSIKTMRMEPGRLLRTHQASSAVIHTERSSSTGCTEGTGFHGILMCLPQVSTYWWCVTAARWKM